MDVELVRPKLLYRLMLVLPVAVKIQPEVNVPEPEPFGLEKTALVLGSRVHSVLFCAAEAVSRPILMAVGLPSVTRSTTLRDEVRVASLKTGAMVARAVRKASIVLVKLLAWSALTLFWSIVMLELVAEVRGTSAVQVIADVLSLPLVLPQPRVAKLTMPIRSFPVKVLPKKLSTAVFNELIFE